MTKIKKLTDRIAEELCDAKEYAECYVEHKVENDSKWTQRFKEMSSDELRHATYLHELAVEEINRLKEVVPDPPSKMIDAWNDAHTMYVEKYAWVKQMLEM